MSIFCRIVCKTGDVWARKEKKSLAGKVFLTEEGRWADCLNRLDRKDDHNSIELTVIKDYRTQLDTGNVVENNGSRTFVRPQSRASAAIPVPSPLNYTSSDRNSVDNTPCNDSKTTKPVNFNEEGGNNNGNMPTQNTHQDTFPEDPCFSPIETQPDRSVNNLIKQNIDFSLDNNVAPSTIEINKDKLSQRQDERCSSPSYSQDCRRCSSPGLRSVPSSGPFGAKCAKTWRKPKTSLCLSSTISSGYSSGFSSWPTATEEYLHQRTAPGMTRGGSGSEECCQRVGLRSSHSAKTSSNGDDAFLHPEGCQETVDELGASDISRTSPNRTDNSKQSYLDSGIHSNDPPDNTRNTFSRSDPQNDSSRLHQSQCSIEECQHKCPYKGCLKLQVPPERGGHGQARSCHSCIETCDASTSPHVPMPVCPWKNLQEKKNQFKTANPEPVFANDAPVQHKAKGHNYDHDVFLEYSHQDSAWVERLSTVLERPPHNLRTYMYDRDKILGRLKIPDISKQIKNSYKFICILSPSFLNNPMCMNNLNMAVYEQTFRPAFENFVILLQIASCEIPAGIDHMIWLDCCNFTDAPNRYVVQKVVEAIRNDS